MARRRRTRKAKYYLWPSNLVAPAAVLRRSKGGDNRVNGQHSKSIFFFLLVDNHVKHGFSINWRWRWRWRALISFRAMINGCTREEIHKDIIHIHRELLKLHVDSIISIAHQIKRNVYCGVSRFLSHWINLLGPRDFPQFCDPEDSTLFSIKKSAVSVTCFITFSYH